MAGGWSGCLPRRKEILATPRGAGLGDGLRVGARGGAAGGDGLGGVEAALDDEVVPGVEDRDLVPARVGRPPLVELGAVPVALEVDLVVEGDQVGELVQVIAIAIDPVLGGAVPRG